MPKKSKKSKKYVVRLTHAERAMLQQIVRKFQGTAPKVRRAQVLLQSDADGPDGTDAKIAAALGCRTQTVENIPERFVTRDDDALGHPSVSMDANRPTNGTYILDSRNLDHGKDSNC